MRWEGHSEANTAELWWLDLGDGRVLRRDRVNATLAGYPVVAVPADQSGRRTAVLVGKTRLFVSNGVKASLLDPASSKLLWERDVSFAVPPRFRSGRKDGNSPEVEWPFAVVRYQDKGFEGGVLIDLRSGAAHAIARRASSYVLGMDVSCRELYTMSGGRLSVYRLPR